MNKISSGGAQPGPGGDEGTAVAQESMYGIFENTSSIAQPRNADPEGKKEQAVGAHGARPQAAALPCDLEPVCSGAALLLGKECERRRRCARRPRLESYALPREKVYV
ncbi:hypothetical protein NDU88_002368 [Pleurodeles waltl]|uniref:Uncharacterized protein n=1 Tax=Pleurodeles waltl TaxID=8319 RepID=A0AAV7RDR3_PLEWA|nr:hypothetical protein NDU88_002368 [Pleurodeles waltl]